MRIGKCVLLLLGVLILPLVGCRKAFTAEYLVDFRVGHRYVGNFIVYDREGEVFGERSLFESIGIPAVKDMPLSVLSQYGRVEFDRQGQHLLFMPDDPEMFRPERQSILDVTAELNIQPKRFDFKGIDYQLTYSNRFYYYTRLTGRLWGFDADLWVQDGRDGTVQLQWHREEHPYVKDVRLGYLPEYDLYGLSATNEPYTRYKESFGTQQEYLYYPIGTRLEIFRNSEYIGSFLVDATPYVVNLELTYGVNDFLIVAYRPDGVIEKKQVLKVVDSFMVPEGNLQYLVVFGEKRHTDRADYRVRLSYGLSNNITTSADLLKDDFHLLAYLKPGEGMLIRTRISREDGEVSLFGQWKPAAVTLTLSKKVSSLRVALRKLMSPTISLHYDENDTLTGSARLFYRGSNGIYISPYIEFAHSRNSRNSATVGGNLLLPIDTRFRVLADLRMPLTGGNHEHLGLSVIRTLPEGELGLKTVFRDLSRLQETELFANLYRFRYASVNFRVSYNYLVDDLNLWVGITGSLTPTMGLHNTLYGGQAERGYLVIRPFLDANLNRRLDDNEQILYATVSVDGVRYQVEGKPLIINNLLPYRTYTITAEGEVDVEPFYHIIAVTVARGSIGTVDIPYYEVEDVEGYVEDNRNNVEVALYVDGKLYKKTRTRFGGYYHFRVPAHLKPREIKILQ